MGKSKGEPLTKTEQEKLIKELADERFGGQALLGLFSFVALMLVVAGILEKNVGKIIFGATSTGLSIWGWISIIHSSLKIKKCIKNNTYTYHHIDILEYQPGGHINYFVYYHLNGKQMVSTKFYGLTKVHVFDCEGEQLARADERSRS